MGTRKRRADELRGATDDSGNESYPATPEKRARTLDYRGGATLETSNEGSSYEDRLTDRQTQLLAKQRLQEPTKNVPAEGGIALSVTCENFMCHENLTVPLGPFMNFVIGHNGSGKSAVLTALTLCLGGKAASTNRAASIKNLIKTGKDTARLTVRLKNEGDGFKVEQYGNEIHIERTFNRDGVSGYKLKSKSGKIISSKREELDDICDFYGLQVDNPMTVLTQDMAREFLSNASNAKKYELFAKGVQLEQLDQDYRILKNGIKQIEVVLDSKQEAVEVIRGHMDAAKKKLEFYNSSREMRRRHEELLHQMTWAQVEDQEKLLQQFSQEVIAAKARVDQIEDTFRKQSEKFDEAHRAFLVAETEYNIEKDKLDPLEDVVKGLKEAEQTYKTQMQGFQREEREIKEFLSNTNKRIEQQKEKIAAEKDRLAARDGGSHEDLEHQITATKSSVKALQQRANEMREKNKLDVKLQNESKIENADIRSRLEAKDKEISQARLTLHSIRSSVLDPMKAFSPQHEALCKAIDQETGWLQKPIGPLGRYVRLRKPQWVNIVENFFGSTFDGYLVTNREDAERLTRLKAKLGCSQIPQFTTPERNFSIDEPDPKYDTILRVLDISEPGARRHFIIAHAAEQAILIEDSEDANRIMATVCPTDHITHCFTLNRNKPSWGYRVGGRGGGMGMSPVHPWKRQSRMNTSKADEEQAATQRLGYLQQERSSINDELERSNKRLNEISQSLRDFVAWHKKLNADIQREESQIEDLQNSLDDAMADGNLPALEGELEMLELRKEGYETAYRDFVVEKDRVMSENDVMTKIEAAQQDVILCKQHIENARHHMENAQRRRSYALQQKNEIDTAREAATQDLALKEDEQNEQKKGVEDMIVKANQVHPRVAVPRDETAQTLDKKLSNSKNRLEALAKELGGSEEELSSNYQRTLDDYQQSKDAVEESKKLLTESHPIHKPLSAVTLTLVQLLMKLYKTRKHRWEQFLQHISARARSQFLYLMCERAFKGRLRLEHHLKPPELIIEVQPGLNESGNRGPKTLSGGEKSFSQICLLLALWEAMGSPIRCLDEFDVFMDPVNRSVSVDMMCKSARRSTGKQFILITPQSMNISESDQTKVFRMPEPKRGGQTTLDNFVR